jgi:ABC-type oligopeptide transport system substrate-binding subunit
MVLEELARRQPAYNGLANLAIRAVEPQITTALRGEDYRGARYFLGRLQAIAPGTPLYKDFVAEMSQRSAAILARAKEAQAQGKHSEAVALVNESARIWPDTAGLVAAHKAIVERYQQVLVGVTTAAGRPTAYPFESVAEARRRSLTEIPLFEPYAFEGGAARYRTRFFDEWIPSDLGRTTRFTLRQTRQPWESQPVLLAWAVADRLRERLDPAHPRYDERLAGYVESLRVESPFEFTMTFRRPPPRLEALLTDPIVNAPAASADQTSAGELAEPLPAGAFQLTSSDDRAATFRRYYAEPDRQRQYHVAEVVEVLYDNPEAALSALQAGEVSVLPDMPAWIIRRAQNEPDLQRDFFVQQHALPETHVIQFNPESPVLASRELRRALTYAVDRRRILDDVLLRQPGGSQGRVTTGPFPSASRANALGVEPRPYDPYAGLALVFAAQETLKTSKVITGQFPVLRMIAPSEPLLREAAERIVAGWKRIGIAVEIVPDDDATAYAEGRWDLLYRRVQMTEPVVDLWPFLTRQPTARIEDLSRVPDWLKQEILDLDRASDAIRAEDRAKTLHRHLALEAAIIPLWELDQYTIYRKTLRGFVVHPLHCYDNIDEWVQDASLQAIGR